MATLAVPSDYPTITDAVQAAQPGDTIFLAAGYVNETALVTVEGITVEGDATNTGISLNVDPAIVQIRLAGSAPINVTGSDADNRIFGNSGDTALDGGDGNDTIDPGNGNDTVDGGSGTDVLQVNYAGASAAVSGGISAGTLADGYSGSLSDSAELPPEKIVELANQWFLPQHIIIGHLNWKPLTTVFDQLRSIIVDRGLTTVTLNDVFSSDIHP